MSTVFITQVDKNSYWDLIAIKTTDIDNKYIGRRGYGKLTVNGLDRLKNDLTTVR